METPEQKARAVIDRLLIEAGWVIQDRKDFNRTAALGVAVREFPLPAGEADYLLFVDGKAAGTIEAKPEGTTLSVVLEQSEKYTGRLPDFLTAWGTPLPFNYESTGTETLFTDQRDPKPRQRRLFAFHKPETLKDWLEQPDTLRRRLQQFPPLDPVGLRDCQIEALHGLERSLGRDNPRALIQMATGAGKTFTACSFSYRLIKHAKARRILFLVDRNNLGDQTYREFSEFQPRGSAYRFTDEYVVQPLHGRRIEPNAKVVITTIQRLYAMLRGKELEEEDEEASGFERWQGMETLPEEVAYNPDVPIETFDFIVVDECHRSIYGLWRQVLEYFDAHIIGLTATPSAHTLGFFNQNLVSEYPYERSVADGVNVGYEIYRIKTRVSEEGGVIKGSEDGFVVPVRDKRTRKVRYEALDRDLPYKPDDLDRAVLNPNQIRAVLKGFKDRVFTDLFPERSGEWLPKTLIFAKDDSHAEDIVHIAREVFGEGNDFVKKVTYRAENNNPKSIIKAFRVEPMPRIAVTVDMIATGTDIKPVEILIFMRDVKSEGYYEQMKGRGVRSIPVAELQQVTPDAHTKTRFILVDAVGVTESKKNASQPLERKRTVSFEKLLEHVAMGQRDEDALSSLAGRLAALDAQLEPDEREQIMEVSGGKSPAHLASDLIKAIDPDVQREAVIEQHGEHATPEQEKAVVTALLDDACAPFNNPELRQRLVNIKRRKDTYIDETTPDEVTAADYDVRNAEQTIRSFKAFMEENRDTLTALQIIYNQPYGKQKLTYAAIRDLVRALRDNKPYLAVSTVWQAYKRLDAAHVRGAPVDDQLTEAVSLVRFALGQVETLEPFGVAVQQRFNLWLGREKNLGREYTPEQQDWLRTIAKYIEANAEISPQSFMEAPGFTDKGGLIKARQLFGDLFPNLLHELQEALVA